jgi:hypothetical protein
MFLHIDKFGVPMKVVFRLADKLRDDPERVRLAQELTLDSSRPRMGLRGSHGLFGSQEWWRNIEEGGVPLLHVSGVIERAYVAGQDGSDINNAIDVRVHDGSVRMIGIYVNDKKDVDLFCPGCRVGIVYVRDQLKQQPAADGGPNYLDIALEMAVSAE